MIEVVKTQKCRVRLYIDKLFQLRLSPWILLLGLEMLARQQSVESEPNFDTEEVVNLEHDESYRAGQPANSEPPGADLWPALP